MAWKVKYVDYPKQFRNMEAEIMETIRGTLAAGDLILRRQTEDFETNLASFVGTRFAVGVSNCTDAMLLAFIAAGIGQGDEVITVSHTFVATAEAIHHAGATPVLIDIRDDHCMDVTQIEKAITSRTKAITPVQVNGHLCEMDTVMEVAEKHSLIVIEDSAQALGGSYKGRKAGSWGLAGCFSFYPAKVLGAFGDAGAVVTDSEEINKKVRWLRDHGRAPETDVAGWSFNHRIDNLQAAILDLKLKRLPEWLQCRRKIAGIYQGALGNVSQLHLPPAPDDGVHHDVYQNYEIEAENRDGLVAHLRKSGVEIMLPWGGHGVHQFEALGLGHFSLPKTEEMFSKALMLPMYPELEDEDVCYVADTIKAFYS